VNASSDVPFPPSVSISLPAPISCPSNTHFAIEHTHVQPPEPLCATRFPTTVEHLIVPPHTASTCSSPPSPQLPSPHLLHVSPAAESATPSSPTQPQHPTEIATSLVSPTSPLTSSIAAPPIPSIDPPHPQLIILTAPNIIPPTPPLNSSLEPIVPHVHPMTTDRTKFGYSQENEPIGRIALRKYRDRTTENGVL
jgi:hypothetical protein